MNVYNNVEGKALSLANKLLKFEKIAQQNIKYL